ncbi:unnamed protein product [Parajaminaea phylloscopi]
MKEAAPSANPHRQVYSAGLEASMNPYTAPTPTPPPMLTLEQATWAWILAGRSKHQLDLGKRFVKAFMAGLFLSTGGTLVGTLTADPWMTTNTPGLLKIIQGAVFPFGFVMIVLLQMDLVTGQMAIMLAATVKRKVPLWAWLLDWSVVFVGNLAGSLLYSGFVYGSSVYTPPMQSGIATLATGKAGPAVNFGQVVVRGIGCNMLVCIAMFQASLAKDMVSKIVAAWFPIFFFVATGFEHVVASMYLIPEGLYWGAKFSTARYIWNGIIPAFIGNVVGAALLTLPLVYLYGGDDFDPDQAESARSGTSLAHLRNDIHAPAYAQDVERAEP